MLGSNRKNIQIKDLCCHDKVHERKKNEDKNEYPPRITKHIPRQERSVNKKMNLKCIYFMSLLEFW